MSKGYSGVVNVGAMGACASADFRIALIGAWVKPLEVTKVSAVHQWIKISDYVTVKQKQFLVTL